MRGRMIAFSIGRGCGSGLGAHVLIHNRSPFVPFLFRVGEAPGPTWWTLLVKATYARRGAALEVHPEQERVLLAAEHRDGPRSSLRRDTDLVPHKPRADVHVCGSARAPLGRPRTDWMLSVQVGALSKTFRVTGPRAWQRSLGSYTLTPAARCLEVPLCYELAFGGCRDDGAGGGEVFEPNPVGRGFALPRPAPLDELIPAPQIEAIDDPIGRIGRCYTAVGVAPTAPSWLARRRHVGTLDERWRAERWPALPENFSEAFYNSAAEGLQADGYLDGSERVHVSGVHPDGDLDFRLPGRRVVLVLGFHDTVALIAPRLDTLVLDVDDDRVVMVWRARIDAELGLRSMEVHVTRAEAVEARGGLTWR